MKFQGNYVFWKDLAEVNAVKVEATPARKVSKVRMKYENNLVLIIAVSVAFLVTKFGAEALAEHMKYEKTQEQSRSNY